MDLMAILDLLMGTRDAYAKDYPTDGEVSYYTNKSVDPRWGGITKSGQKFDENKMTMAILPEYWKEHKNKYFKVTNPKTGNNVLVQAIDTGGFGKYGRVGDLSKAAFESLFPTKQGTGNVTIEPYENK